MAAGIITYAARIDGCIKTRALLIIIDHEPSTEDLELFMQGRLIDNEYLIDIAFAWINDETKARICAEG